MWIFIKEVLRQKKSSTVSMMCVNCKKLHQRFVHWGHEIIDDNDWSSILMRHGQLTNLVHCWNSLNPGDINDWVQLLIWRLTLIVKVNDIVKLSTICNQRMVFQEVYSLCGFSTSASTRQQPRKQCFQSQIHFLNVKYKKIVFLFPATFETGMVSNLATHGKYRWRYTVR